MRAWIYNAYGAREQICENNLRLYVLLRIGEYKDELPPRILVQVKSQDGDIRETTIQSLKGAMREGDYGLFVTLSNYTKNAKNILTVRQ